ncbi:MAG TPA: class I SAM-dependent methyltransferase [Terracidiphilus sp.]
MRMTEEKQAFFNQIAPSWDDMQQDSPEIKSGIRHFVQSAYLKGAKTILDVGCGTGVLVPHLLTEYPNAQLIVELDFAEEMLAVNRTKHTDPRLARLAANATNLPLPDESIDVVLCFNAAPHLGSGEIAFRDLFRVLARGGMFAVGHLMNSSELNQFHGNLHSPMVHDHLPPARELGNILSGLGGINVVAEEQQGWYFVRAERTK